MHAQLLDRPAGLDGPIQALPTPVKLLAAVALVAATIAVPRHHALWLLAVAALLLIIAMLSRLSWRPLARRMLLLEAFVVGVAVLSLFQPNGWAVGLVLMAKSSLCLFTMLLLSNTTPFGETLRTLRSAHVPELFVTTMALMYRYLFVLVDETQRMRRARQSRTFVQKRSWTWQSLATIIGQLFIRASERADRIYSAMCARGWR